MRHGLLRIAGALAVLAAALTPSGSAQVRPPYSRVTVIVAPDRPDWTYAPGQEVTFTVAALRDGHPVPNARLSYRLGPEMLPPTEERQVTLGAGPSRIKGGTMRQPGFLRLIADVEVEGISYRGIGTAAFSPEAIKPTAEQPADFDAFWDAGREQLAAIPLDPIRTPMAASSTSKVECWQVSLQNAGSSTSRTPSRLYGVLCEPRAPGKYPALLSVPGAGVRGYRGVADLAEKGIVTLQIGIHGIPVDMDARVYEDLGRGALVEYMLNGLDSQDRYYYRRVYLGCVRANDYLTSLDKWDGRNLAVTGGSQGGALSIVTAGLDSRVTVLGAFYPALSDVTGYLHGRAGGWPHMFRTEGAGSHRVKEKVTTAAYYDVVNFARRVKAPGLYSWGFNDETCPPTSMYAAYNVIAAPKTLLLALDTGHRTTPEQTDKMNAWLETQLKGATASQRQ